MIAFLAGLRRSRRRLPYTLTVLILTALGWGLLSADEARRIGQALRLRGFKR
jgi:hypothetical protein